MKIYLLKQEDVRGYDTYDSAIVAAESKELAIRTPVDDYMEWNDCLNCWTYNYREKLPIKYFSWASHINQIEAVEIGEAKDGVKPGLILASFNAG